MAIWYSTGVPWYAADTAGFRAWGVAFTALFPKAGLVKTTDTGQINWATVTKPTVSGFASNAGYEIWRFDDALQGTVPCYIKIQFGVSATVYNSAAYITLGKGTDGAGNLTDGVYCGALRQATDDSTLAPTWNVMSGSTGHIGGVFGVWGTSNNQTNGRGNGHRFFIERTKDPLTGLSTSDGILCTINDPSNVGLRMSVLGYTVANQSYTLTTNPFPASNGGSSYDRTSWVGNEIRPKPALLLGSNGKWLLGTGFLYCTPTDLNHTARLSVTIGSGTFQYQPCWENFSNGENVNEANESVGYVFGNNLYGGVLIRE